MGKPSLFCFREEIEESKIQRIVQPVKKTAADIFDITKDEFKKKLELYPAVAALMDGNAADKVSERAQEELKKLVKENSKVLVEKGVSKAQDSIMSVVPTTQQEVVEMILHLKEKLEKDQKKKDKKKKRKEKKKKKKKKKK